MKLLVTGRYGKLARALVRRAEAAGVAVDTLGRPELDLERPEDIASLIASFRPDAVINAAAYTDVERAEIEPDRAYAINATGAEAVAKAAVAANAALIQISTDFVFRGDKANAYVEIDATGPVSAYGASKLEGEQRVCAAHPKAIVVRTAWVFDAHGPSFVRAVLRRARDATTIPGVIDERGSPTFADDLAEALLGIAVKAVNGRGRAGVYHCAGEGAATRAAFAEEIFVQARARGGPGAVVEPAHATDFAARAKRPANSVLNCDKLAAHYGIRMRPWRAALAACIDDIAAGGWRLD